VFLHSLLILRKDCNYPKFVVGLLTPNAMFFYFLFNDFYQSAYKKKMAQPVKVADGSAEKQTEPDNKAEKGD